jgi:hypothetical protein
MFEKFRNYVSESYEDFKQEPTKYILKKPYIALALAATGLLRAALQVVGFYVAILLFTEVALVALAGNIIAAVLTLIPAIAALHYSGPPFTIAKTVINTILKPVTFLCKFALGNLVDYCLVQYGFVDKVKNRPVGELFEASPLVSESEDNERPKRNQSLAWNLIIDTVEFGFGPFRFSPSASFRYNFPYDLGLGLINKIFYDTGLEDRARSIHRKRIQEQLLAETRELVNFLHSPQVLNNHIPSTREETAMREELKLFAAQVRRQGNDFIRPSKIIAPKPIVVDRLNPNTKETGKLVIAAKQRQEHEVKLIKSVVTKPSQILQYYPQEVAKLRQYQMNTILRSIQQNMHSDQNVAKVKTTSVLESTLRKITPSATNYLYANTIKAREQQLDDIRSERASHQAFSDGHKQRTEQRINKAMLYMQTLQQRNEAQQRLNYIFTESKRPASKTIRKKHEAMLEEIKRPGKKLNAI